MDQQNALVPSEKQEEKSSYWARVGGIYRFFFRAVLLLIPVFVTVFMALCAGGFTRNSVFGFRKDLGAISSFLASDYKTVSYTYYEGARTVLSYHDGVAAVTCGGIEIYSPDGERLLNVERVFSDPRAVCSQKYLLAYDFGTGHFLVTSAYGVLFSGETDFPIYGAVMADTGHFALITGSDTHLSQVLLYDANFHLIQRFSRGSATTGVSLSDNGKYVAIGGISAKSGVENGLVSLYRIGAENAVFEITLEEAVLSVDFTDNRHLAVLGAESLRVLDLDGEWESVTAFQGALPTALDVNENGFALSICTDPARRESRVVIGDKKGNVLYDGIQNGDISDIVLTRESAFFLCGTKITRFSLETDTRKEALCPDGAQGIFAVNDSVLRVIYAGEARLLEFD